MKNILVLCTGNSCRSQMAHGYLEHFAGKKARIYSAGIAVHGLHPFAIGIMAEDGIDISTHTSNHIDEYSGIRFHYVITVCDHAEENCPFLPGTAGKIHHNFNDPSKATGSAEALTTAFRKTREEIKAFCKDFTTRYL